MNFNPNFENNQNLCRICLKSGYINIWTCRISLNQDPEINEIGFPAENATEKSFVEIMNMFCNSEDLLNLAEEFPLLCQQCLEDLKYCHLVYEKIKRANIQLINLFQETLNQCIEEEHLIDITEEKELKSVVETNLTEMLEDNINLPQYVINNESVPTAKLNQSRIRLDKNDSFIITQFIPETLEVPETCVENDDTEFHSTQNLLTVNLKAVEVQNPENVDRIETPLFLKDNTESAIYVCQYCPQAFAKSEYLKTHIQKSHVCKFCTQPFNVTEDLFIHIRTHTEHKCAICQKLLSSGTNLRHHIRRVHHIKLPAKVTLIDFIKSSSIEEAKPESEMEVLQEFGTAELELSAPYSWKSDDSIEMLTEDNNSEID